MPWRNHTQRAVSFICECMDRQPAGAVSFITAASEKAIPSLLGMYGWFCTFRGNQFTRSNPRGKRRIKDIKIEEMRLQETEVVDVQWVNPDKLFEMFRLKHLHPLITYVDQLIG